MIDASVMSKRVKSSLINSALCLLSLASFGAQADTSKNLGKDLNLVVLSPSAVEMLFAIGAGSQVKATIAYADYPEQAKSLPRLGRHDYLDIEKILQMAPDYVVLGRSDTSMPLIEQLERHGLTIVDTSITGLDQIPLKLEMLGELTGHQAKAEEVASTFQAELNSLRSQYRHREPVRLFYQVYQEPLITSVSGWLSELITDCGGENIFGKELGDYPQVSLEQVLMRQPEVIIHPTSHGIAQDDSAWQRWPMLPAVKNQRIYTIEGDLLNRAGPRVLSGMTQLCQALDSARRGEGV